MDSVGKERQVQMDTQVGRKMDDRWVVEKWMDGCLNRRDIELWSVWGKDEWTG